MRKLTQRARHFCKPWSLVVNSLSPMCRSALGRWHVFRDTPYWVVKHWAEEQPGTNPESASLVRQAQQELELRHRQRALTIKQQIEAELPSEKK